MSADAKELAAGAALGADRLEPVRAPVDDRRDVGQGLDVVHQGGLAPQAGFCRVGGLDAGLAALAFQ